MTVPRPLLEAPVLRALAITAGYDGPPVLDDAAVSAEAGRTTVILGPNGAGKSTLAEAIVGLLRIRGGHVYLAGSEVTGLAPHKLVRRGLGHLPQLANVFDDMSVRENLEMGGYTPRATCRHASRRCSSCSRTSPSTSGRRQARCQAASSGCSPSPGC
jgi:branched-chain amino acid transport system ATP-binding protein